MTVVENLPELGRLNVADRLSAAAAMMRDTVAVACPTGNSQGAHDTRKGISGDRYATITFAKLEADATRIARGLSAWGVQPGTRLALLVRPGIEFVTLVFGLLRAGVVIVLIDPGMGRRNFIRCLAEAEPEGFVAIPQAQAIRTILRRQFPRAKWNVTVGRRWFWGGMTLEQLRIKACKTQSAIRNPQSASTGADDPAAIIFTSGSTGPPKGVLYTHRMFDTQVAEIQSTYSIEPGSIDLSCFPMFSLFNAAMGVTTVLPKMDFSRPASANPRKLLTAANDWKATQAFASPAVWRVLADYCAKTGERIPTMRRVFSCGAPVPAEVIRGTLAFVGDGAKMHTPYGATECLPVSTIDANEILQEAAERTATGAGVCVGRKFDSIEWRVIRITNEPIASIEDAEELALGQIGELIVRGPQVSGEYVTRTEANAVAKIVDGRRTEYSVPSTIESCPPPASACDFAPWHRTGDVGYLDEKGRFWYCGRKSQRVETAAGPLFTECVEGVFNTHPEVDMAALVGIGQPGHQLPIIALKFKPSVRIGRYSGAEAFADFEPLAAKVIPSTTIRDWMEFEELPVDIRHNSKINREFLREGVVIGILAEPKLFHPELVARAKQMS